MTLTGESISQAKQVEVCGPGPGATFFRIVSNTNEVERIEVGDREYTLEADGAYVSRYTRHGNYGGEMVLRQAA